MQTSEPPSYMGGEISAAIVGGATGALAGLCATFWSEHLKREAIWRGLDLTISKPHQNKIAGRVINNSRYSMTECFVYLTVRYDVSRDIVTWPASRVAHIKPADRTQFEDDRLHWSIANNPAKMDVYSGERQAFELLEYDDTKTWLGVFSEDRKIYRVFLRGDQRYYGEIKVISKDTRYKTFPVVIDLTEATPVKLQFRYPIWPETKSGETAFVHS